MTSILVWDGPTQVPGQLMLLPLWPVTEVSRTAGAPPIMSLALPTMNSVGPMIMFDTIPVRVPASSPLLNMILELRFKAGVPTTTVLLSAVAGLVAAVVEVLG